MPIALGSTALSRLPALRIALPPRQHWPAPFALMILALLYVLAALGLSTLDPNPGRAFAHGVLPSFSRTVPAAEQPQGPPPVPEPMTFRDMTPQEALAYNDSIPVSSESNPAARPFLLASASDLDRHRSLDCLTAAVYYEAAIEPTNGQRAVAQVVLNRLRHPAFPKTICGVVFQGSERSTGCQFTFTCDGALARTPSADGWARARKVAEEALAGAVYKPVGYSTHYHTDWVVPYWSSTLTKVANVGSHIFYRWEGGWGRPPAFHNSYAGAEPQVALLAKLSPAHAIQSADQMTAAQAIAAGVDLPAVQVTDADLKHRVVFREYEPLRDEAAASANAELAKADVPASLRWGLTGETGAAKATPLGTKVPKVAATAPAAVPAAPAAPAATVPSPAAAGPAERSK